MRADLQQYYGIDIDRAMAGEHSADHVATLVEQLPHGCRTFRALDPDAAWSHESVLLAMLANSLNALIYGLSDRDKRGMPPQPVGPSWMTAGRRRSLESRAMPVDELMRVLSLPRRNRCQTTP